MSSAKRSASNRTPRGHWVTIREGHPLVGHHVFIEDGRIQQLRAPGMKRAHRVHSSALRGRDVALVLPAHASAHDLSRVTRERLFEEARDLDQARRLARRDWVASARREWIREHGGYSSLGQAIRLNGGIGHTGAIRRDYDLRVPPAYTRVRGQGIDGLRESLHQKGFTFPTDDALVKAIAHAREWTAAHAGHEAGREFDQEETYTAMAAAVRARARKKLEKRAYTLAGVPF